MYICHKIHDSCSHKKYMEAGAMTFVAHGRVHRLLKAYNPLSNSMASTYLNIDQMGT